MMVASSRLLDDMFLVFLAVLLIMRIDLIWRHHLLAQFVEVIWVLQSGLW